MLRPAPGVPHSFAVTTPSRILQHYGRSLVRSHTLHAVSQGSNKLGDFCCFASFNPTLLPRPTTALASNAPSPSEDCAGFNPTYMYGPSRFEDCAGLQRSFVVRRSHLPPMQASSLPQASECYMYGTGAMLNLASFIATCIRSPRTSQPGPATIRPFLARTLGELDGRRHCPPCLGVHAGDLGSDQAHKESSEVQRGTVEVISHKHPRSFLKG